MKRSTKKHGKGSAGTTSSTPTLTGWHRQSKPIISRMRTSLERLQRRWDRAGADSDELAFAMRDAAQEWQSLASVARACRAPREASAVQRALEQWIGAYAEIGERFLASVASGDPRRIEVVVAKLREDMLVADLHSIEAARLASRLTQDMILGEVRRS